MLNQPEIRGLVDFIYFFKHSLFGFCSQNFVMRQNNIAQEINSLLELSDNNFIRMQSEFQLVFQKLGSQRN
jgi:hypothetical protein